MELFIILVIVGAAALVLAMRVIRGLRRASAAPSGDGAACESCCCECSKRPDPRGGEPPSEKS